MDKIVLIVVDDPQERRLLETHLAGVADEVLTANNGAEALPIIRARTPDVVIADWTMPKMGGVELCRALRRRQGLASVYVIILVADAEKDHLCEAWTARADDYVAKPVDLRDLSARVRTGQRIVDLERRLAEHHREAEQLPTEIAVAGEQQSRAISTEEWTSDKSIALDAAQKRGLSGAHVLVVDDDAGARALFGKYLERKGCQIEEAVDGIDALEKVRREQPDVIVMDVMMPNMDGSECTRRLKADPATRDISIIMASAGSEEKDIIAGLEAGADEYITKPIRPKEFIIRVESMIRFHSSRLELIRSNEVRGEQTRALTLLLDFSRDLATGGDLDAVLDRIVYVASELTSSRRISIMLPDSKGEYLTIARSMGIDESLASSVRVPVGSATAGKVFESRQAIVINSPQEVDSPKEIYDSPFFASIPLLSKALGTSKRVVGVLNITDRFGSRPFEPGELGYIDLLSNIAASAIEEIVTRMARDEAQDSIMVALAKLAEHRDNDTGKHLDRVTKFSLILAARLRDTSRCSHLIDDQFLHALGRAVPLHDIGKVAIPDRILLKPGKLTDQEMDIMKTHALVGAETIRSVLDRTPGALFLKMAEEITHFHHEWFNGEGYPRGLKGHDIPLSARITALADVYDALTTERPYKKPFSHEKATAIILEVSGTQFDPEVVEAFLAHEEEFRQLAAELADDVSDLPGQPSEIAAVPLGQGC